MGSGAVADFARGPRVRTRIVWLAVMLMMGIGSASTAQSAGADELSECVEVTEYVDGGFINPGEVFLDKTLDVAYDGVGPATLADSCEGEAMYVNDGLTLSNLTNGEGLEHDFSEGCSGSIVHKNLDITSVLGVGNNRLRFVAYDLCGGGASMGHTYILGVTLPPPPIEMPPAPVGPPVPSDFATALFDGTTLYLRVKCPPRFKPQCLGTAAGFTSKVRCTRSEGRRHCKAVKPITASASAKQKPNEWKVFALKVKPKYRKVVRKMAREPNKKLLYVRELIHAKRFKHGRRQAVYHKYRVLTASN